MAEYRLLAIDDNQNIADLICEAAKGKGFKARKAVGPAALDLYRDFQPHVIFLDLLMPEIDGQEFLHFLKTQNSKTHVVLLSGSSEEYRQIAENFGTSGGLTIEASLPKPFRVGEVRDILDKIKQSLSAKDAA